MDVGADVDAETGADEDDHTMASTGMTDPGPDRERDG